MCVWYLRCYTWSAICPGLWFDGSAPDAMWYPSSCQDSLILHSIGWHALYITPAVIINIIVVVVEIVLICCLWAYVAVVVMFVIRIVVNVGDHHAPVHRHPRRRCQQQAGIPHHQSYHKHVTPHMTHLTI